MQPAEPPYPPVAVETRVAAWRAGGLSRRELRRRTGDDGLRTHVDVTPPPSHPVAIRRVNLRPRRA
jgi:hypothetical protein